MTKKFSKKIIGLAVLVVIAGYFLPLPILALDYTPLAPLPVGENGQTLNKVTDAGVYIKGAFNLAIGVAAALAIIMIIIGGIQYMGTESIGGKGAGLKKIKDAVLGLLLALGSYLILFTINPSLVNFNLNVGAITPPTNSTPTPPVTQKFVLQYGPLEYLITYSTSVLYSFSYSMTGSGLAYPAGPFNSPATCNQARNLYIGKTSFLSPCSPDTGAATSEQHFGTKEDCNLFASALTTPIVRNCVENHTPVTTEEFNSYQDCSERADEVRLLQLGLILPTCQQK